MSSISRVLVANRGEIASRVFRTCRRLGIGTVAVFSDADATLPYVREADLAVRLPGSPPTETYLRGDLIVAAALRSGADAIHPGYGFLSENASFARAVIDAGLVWIGPSPESIEQMGSKIGAKALMKAAGVPVLEAPEVPTEADLPLLVKASAGGGGRGMRIVRSLADLDTEIGKARAEAASAFGDGTVFVEPYVERGRHVEVQIWGDHGGVNVSAIGTRDCSIQRRHQKVVEEAPAPAISAATEKALMAAAQRAGEAIGYSGAGTVEFLLDADHDPDFEEVARFWFLEMNTRLQVEHPVTEETTGLDLVELQLKAAFEGVGSRIGFVGDGFSNGFAIEVRLYAEDPAEDYQPHSGVLTRFEIPEIDGIRVEAAYESGTTVTTFYDPMIAKVIAHAPTRTEAARRLAAALRRARIHGLRTNREQLVAILESEAFLAEKVSTAFLSDAGPLGAVGESPEAAAAPRASLERQGVRVAAAVALVETAKAAQKVQRRIPAGWRNVTSQPQRVEFTDGTNAEWLGTRTGYAVDGVTVVSAAPERVVLEVDGLQAAYDICITGDRIDVDGPAGHTALERIPRFVDPSTRVEEGSLLAPMPGSVVAVHVAVGDRVEEGQPIVVMEAMKMQHTVAAPYAGTVAELDVSAGQQVEAGAVLAVVEPAEPVEPIQEEG